MKGLDTGALLEILEGAAGARKAVKKLRGEELATTELNLLELSVLAGKGAPRGRAERFAAIGRLRRRLTVLPIDGRAIDLAARQVTGGAGALPVSTLAALLAFEAAGCETLLTSDPSSIGGRWSFETRKFA